MTADRENDLPDRTIKANDKPVLVDAAYVLVVLNRALRGEDNPVVDAARIHASQLNLEVVVYCELDETADYASDRLFYFILGAFKELAITLSQRNIRCVQVLKKVGDADVLRSLIAKAAAIYTDEDYTHWDRAKLRRILDRATQTVFLLDASRLVPTRQLPQNLKTTPEFRKAHGKLREHFFKLREANRNESTAKTKAKDIDLTTEHNFASYDDADLIELVQQCNINHDIGISQQHPPTLAEVEARSELPHR